MTYSIPPILMSKKTVLVRYTLEFPVTFEDWEDDRIQFDVEENSCLGTHNAGSQFHDHYIKYKQGYCWACALNCKGEIIDWNYQPKE